MREHKGAMFAIKAAAAVFLIMPLAVMFVYSLADRGISILPEGFTIQYYISTLTNQAFLMGILRGIVISALPVLITNVSVLLALYVVIVYLPNMEKVVQIFCLIPTTINGIIVATSVLSMYAGSGTVFANRVVMLACIYCVFVLPVTYQGIRNSLYAVNTKGILEAAQMLGCRKFYSNVTVVIPSIFPGLAASALMGFAGLFGDFAIIKIIASSQYETAQAFLYRNRQADTQELSSAVIILLLISLAINYAVHKSQNKQKERREK